MALSNAERQARYRERLKAAAAPMTEGQQAGQGTKPPWEQIAPPTPPPDIRGIAIRQIDGELRILDTDLGKRLGFGRPRDIRQLIDRHKDALGVMEGRGTVPRLSGDDDEPYYLNKKQAIFITAKSETSAAAEITIGIIERFDEYERGLRSAPAPIAFDVNDHAQLLAVIGQVGNALVAERDRSAVLTAEKAAADARVVELAPKAAALDRISASIGSENISDTAKVLGRRPMAFFQWLAARDWIFRRYDGGPWRAIQDKINDGLLEHIERPDRRWPDRTFTVCMVTAKGRAKLAQLLQVEREAV